MNRNENNDDIVFEFKKNKAPQQPQQQRPAQQPQQQRLAQQPQQQRPAQQPQQQRLAQQPQQQRPAQQPQQQRPAAHEVSPHKQRKKESKIGRFFSTVIIVSALVGISIFLAFFALGSASDLLGINQVDQQVEIEIPKEAEGSISKVAKILDEAGVIDQRLTFEIYAKFRKMDGSDRGEGKEPRKFLAGNYVVNSKWGYDELMRHISRKDKEADTVSISFYEGMSAAQIAKRLEENGVCTAEAFFTAMEEETYDYEFIGKITDEEYRFRKLEGYLFPDTYYFYLNMNPKDVVDKFLSNFENKMTEELMLDMRNLPNGLGELDNLITLASIIQREVGEPDEMALVSSVFHNRLNNEGEYPHLQSDATAYYIKESIKPYVTTNNQAMYDAYDSTVAKGLPVGPICNPGIDAIRAAIYPEDTNYYFFVSDDRGNYYYAATYEEHQANIATAKQVNKEVAAEEAAKAETEEKTAE